MSGRGMRRTLGNEVNRQVMDVIWRRVLTRLRPFNCSSFSFQTSSFSIGLGDHVCL